MDNFNKGIKWGLFGLAGLLIVTALLFGGYRLGQEKEKSKEQKEEQKEQSEKSEEIQTLTPTSKFTPTLTQTIIPSPTPTPDPTANWKTYKDKSNIFTLKYPPSFYETKDRNYPSGLDLKDAGTLSTVTPYNETFEKESDLLIEFAITSISPQQTLRDYIEFNILTHPQEDTDGDGIVGPPIKITPEKRKAFVIDGRNVEWLEGIAFMSVAHTEVFVPYKNSEIVYIRIWDGTGGQEHKNRMQYDKNMQLVEKILSTFRFLE